MESISGLLSDLQLKRWLKAAEPMAKSDGGGLTFTVSSAGAAAWVLRYRHGGRRHELTLGRYLRSLQARLAQKDVSLGHWTFLRILWEQDGITKRELSIEAGVAEPTTVIALRAMEELGYVRLEQRPDNRKNIYVHLTVRGRRLKGALVPMAEEVNAIALRGLSDGDVDTVRRALLGMIDNLSQDTEAQR